MVTQVASHEDQGTIVLSLFDGTRQPLKTDKEILLRVRDGTQAERYSGFVKDSTIKIRVPFFDNFGDNYTVLVTADGYRDAGFSPVKVSPTLDASLDLMLVPKKAQFKFLAWPDLKAKYPRVCSFINCAGNEQDAQQHYADLLKNKPPALASLLNLIAAMSAINLPSGTPLDYFKLIDWGPSLAQDRFFGFADQRLVDQVRTAAAQGEFAPEPAPGLFHTDATSSYKQIRFGEANAQLTFHEKTTQEIGGVTCIRVEPDIDYYRDGGAHALLEVIPNALSHGLTDPQVVYVLRWIAGRHAGVPEFDPTYILE